MHVLSAVRSKIHFQHRPCFSSLRSYDGARCDITTVQMNFKGRSVARNRPKCTTLSLNSVETLANALFLWFSDRSTRGPEIVARIQFRP